MNESVFISYSRQDRNFVDRLVKDLKHSGINIWMDTERLIPGTRNWENAIRTAIENCLAVILVASPSSMESEFVQGEITVAKMHNRPIYPIWASGNNWINCVPLSMSNHQYLDARDNNYTSGVNELIKTIIALNNNSGNTISLSLPDHSRVQINITPDLDVRTLIDTIYLQFDLAIWFSIWTYGKDWVLCNVHTKQLLLPFTWLSQDHSIGLSLKKYEWADVPTKHFGIQPSELWAVCPIIYMPITGIALWSRDLKNRILTKYGFREIDILKSQGILKRDTATDFSRFEKYPYKFLVAIDDLRIGASRRKKNYLLFEK